MSTVGRQPGDDEAGRMRSPTWTGPMPEPSIPLNAYAQSPSTVSASSPHLPSRPHGESFSMPDPGRYQFSASPPPPPGAAASTVGYISSPPLSPSVVSSNMPTTTGSATVVSDYGDVAGHQPPAFPPRPTTDGFSKFPPNAYAEGTALDDTPMIVVPAPAQTIDHTATLNAYGGPDPSMPTGESTAFPPHVTTSTAGKVDYGTSNPSNVATQSLPPPPPRYTRQRPDGRLFGLRFAQLVSSVSALGFLAGAGSYSGESSPFAGATPVDLYYAVCAVASVIALFFISFMLYRWVRSGKPFSAYATFLLDLIATAILGADSIILMASKKCEIGSLNGWCDFYNTSLFFGFLACVLFAIAMCWDVYFSCCGGNRGRLSQGVRGKRWWR